MLSFYKRLFIRKRQKRFDAFNVLLKMLLKQGKFSMAYFLMDKLFSILKVYIYTFWQKRKLERLVKFNGSYLKILQSFDNYFELLRIWLNLIKTNFFNGFNKQRGCVYSVYFFIKRLKNFLPKFSFFFKFFSAINVPTLGATQNSYLKLSEFSSKIFFYKPIILKFEQQSWKNSLSIFCTFFLSTYINFVDQGSIQKGKLLTENFSFVFKNNSIFNVFFSLYQQYIYFILKLIKYKKTNSGLNAINVKDPSFKIKSKEFLNKFTSLFFGLDNFVLKNSLYNMWFLFIFFFFLKKKGYIIKSSTDTIKLLLFIKFWNKLRFGKLNFKSNHKQKRFYFTIKLELKKFEYNFDRTVFSIFNNVSKYFWSRGSFQFCMKYVYKFCILEPLYIASLKFFLKKNLFFVQIILYYLSYRFFILNSVKWIYSYNKNLNIAKRFSFISYFYKKFYSNEFFITLNAFKLSYNFFLYNKKRSFIFLSQDKNILNRKLNKTSIKYNFFTFFVKFKYFFYYYVDFFKRNIVENIAKKVSTIFNTTFFVRDNLFKFLNFKFLFKLAHKSSLVNNFQPTSHIFSFLVQHNNYPSYQYGSSKIFGLTKMIFLNKKFQMYMSLGLRITWLSFKHWISLKYTDWNNVLINKFLFYKKKMISNYLSYSELNIFKINNILYNERYFFNISYKQKKPFNRKFINLFVNKIRSFLYLNEGLKILKFQKSSKLLKYYILKPILAKYNKKKKNYKVFLKIIFKKLFDQYYFNNFCKFF